MNKHLFAVLALIAVASSSIGCKTEKHYYEADTIILEGGAGSEYDDCDDGMVYDADRHEAENTATAYSRYLAHLGAGGSSTPDWRRQYAPKKRSDYGYRKYHDKSLYRKYRGYNGY
ncbi:MAG: hypothetical protein M3Q73_01235 [bacterium]|nr:hypothetical protein [bacterium]